MCFLHVGHWSCSWTQQLLKQSGWGEREKTDEQPRAQGDEEDEADPEGLLGQEVKGGPGGMIGAEVCRTEGAAKYSRA